jgi:hypothetical protein
VSASVFPDYIGSIVTRAVIYDQNLSVPVLFGGVAQNFIERGPDAAAFVVGGNNEAIGQREFSVLSSQFSEKPTGLLPGH